MDIKFQNNLHSLLKWFLSPKSIGLELDGEHAIHMMARNISLGYQCLKIDEPIVRNETLIIDEINPNDYSGKDKVYLLPVMRLGDYARRELQEFLYDFLIHGSLATFDYSQGWSDFDTYLIINKKTIFNPSALVKLRSKLLRIYPLLLEIDPLQHHGFLVCSETEIDNYVQRYMPIEVLRYAKSYYGQRELTFKIIDSIEEEKQSFLRKVVFFKRVYEKGILEHHAYRGAYLLSDYRNAKNGMYQFKYLLNYIAIIPSYYLGALGRHSYKRDAIASLRSKISSENSETLEKVTLVRSKWPNYEKFPYQGNQIPGWVQNIVGTNYFESAYKFILEFGEALETGSLI